LGTGPAIGVHTGTGGRCADAIEAGVGDDGPARTLTGTESGGLGLAKGGDWAAYVMPGWAGRNASYCIIAGSTRTKTLIVEDSHEIVQTNKRGHSHRQPAGDQHLPDRH